MPDRPLLILPHSTPLPRVPQRRSVAGEHFRLPRREEQEAFIGPQLNNMLDAFVADTPAGSNSENILVLETIGRHDDFRRAVAAVPGLKWLAEIDMDDIAVDARFFELPKIGPNFFKNLIVAFDTADSQNVVAAFMDNSILDSEGYLVEGATAAEIRAAIPQDFVEYSEEILQAIETKRNTSLSGRMYLSLSNRQALNEIKSLFDTWKRDGTLPRGKKAWCDFFSHLRNVRFWDIEDRVRDTGILDIWKKEVELKRGTASTIAFEVEFSFDTDPNSRRQKQQLVEDLVAAEGGTIITTCEIPEIFFHAIKIQVPVASIERVLGQDYRALYKNSGILFFRPSPQCIVELFGDGTIEDTPSTLAPVDASPVVAVLDGLPFSRHNILDGFIIIDDPDNFAGSYQPGEFSHGTAMLSLICRGDLDANEVPISRKVYVRPILKPDEESRLNRRPERVPNDVFFEDLIERAVRKMFSADAGEPASAPTVKIINLSVADPNRMFHRLPGPTARLLDWLSYKYKVLFCVSAGNILDPISLGIDPVRFAGATDDVRITTVFSSLYDNQRNRRILTPSESINAITVGALHDDESTPVHIEGCIDILPSCGLPSPLSPLGHGFRSSIKPEIVIPGGRQLFAHNGDGEYCIPNIPMRSGQKVAAAPVQPGERTRTTYACGTSNATALATRGAAFIHDAILEVFVDHRIDNADSSMAALIKALMVHGASWGEAAELIKATMPNARHATQVKKEIARCLGYGRPNFQKSIECTATRATVIGFSEISKDQRHEYRFPLPPSLSGLSCWRRLTITLAWLTPINAENRKYRKAALSFDATEPARIIESQRSEGDWQQVKNGTLQHEIFEGAKVSVFQEDDSLLIPIQCREDAGPLDVAIPYGLAISLEVKEDVEIDLYEEIKNSIEVAVRAAVRAV